MLFEDLTHKYSHGTDHLGKSSCRYSTAHSAALCCALERSLQALCVAHRTGNAQCLIVVMYGLAQFVYNCLPVIKTLLHSVVR